MPCNVDNCNMDQKNYCINNPNGTSTCYCNNGYAPLDKVDPNSGCGCE